MRINHSMMHQYLVLLILYETVGDCLEGQLLLETLIRYVFVVCKCRHS